MNVDFRNKELLKLYKTGKSKKYRVQDHIINGFFDVVEHLENAHTIHDLWKTKSLKFKRLQGYSTRFSLRIDKKWRLEVEIEWENNEETRGNIYVVELSNHYND